MSLSDYLGRLDWLIAIGAFIIGGLVGLGMIWVLEWVIDEVSRVLPVVNRSVADTLLRWRDVPREPWSCSVCGSLNTATAERCYRGCGTRADVSTELRRDQAADRAGDAEVIEEDWDEDEWAEDEDGDWDEDEWAEDEVADAGDEAPAAAPPQGPSADGQARPQPAPGTVPRNGGESSDEGPGWPPQLRR